MRKWKVIGVIFAILLLALFASACGGSDEQVAEQLVQEAEAAAPAVEGGDEEPAGEAEDAAPAAEDEDEEPAGEAEDAAPAAEDGNDQPAGEAEDAALAAEDGNEEAVIEEPANTADEVAPLVDKWCSDTNIVFFPGGPPDGPFAMIVYNGALAAAADLGANVEYVWSGWNSQRMVSQFIEAAAANPDGIAIMGHPGDDAFGPAVDDARAQGIIVTSQNVALPETENRHRPDGFGYAGVDLYSAGYSLGTEAVNRSGVDAGDRAMVWGVLSRTGAAERTQGVIDALENSNLTIDYVEIDGATHANVSAGTPAFVDYVSANPDVKLVVIDHSFMPAELETYMTSAGLGADDLFAAGFDLSPENLEAIRGGWADLIMDQQPWLQGYLPILQICLTHNYGFSGLHVDTGAGFAHKDNVEMLVELVGKQIR